MAPQIDKLAMQDLVVRAGQRINFTIPIEASPKPKAQWAINGVNVKPGNRVDMQVYQNQVLFEIPFSVRSDTGRYTLTLTNDLGTCSCSANVTVIGKAFSQHFANSIVVENK